MHVPTRACKAITSESRIVGRTAHIAVQDVAGGVVARTRVTGHAADNASRIRLVGVVLSKHGMNHRKMLVRASWRIPTNRVISKKLTHLHGLRSPLVISLKAHLI